MFFTEKNRKKNLIIFLLVLPLFCGVVFLSQTHLVHADLMGHSLAKDTGVDPIGAVTDAAGDMALDIAAYPFKLMLYGLFVLFGWMASLAITLFEWVINPENISGPAGVLNQPAVYEMWKFIRDFFNLFFILVLLYVAFKIVFQIEHDFKKTLLSIVLAALFINFSFPVTRVLIDVTNVPMYFFANQMAAKEGGGTTVFSQVMTATKLEHILLPDGVGTFSTVFSRIFVAVIFLFLFAVTLLVLAVMFIVRLVALVILVIFSPVGFAASIVPGLEQYSKMWWSNFWKYAFFGPAAMLMILVSIRFFSALGDANSGIFKSLINVASVTVATDPTFFASMALFSVPIIMLWMAMGLAQKFSIAGADTVVGKGQAFSKWAGNKTLNGGKWLAYKNPIARGVGSGLKERAENNKVLKFATPKYWKDSGQQRAERIAGYVGDGNAGRSQVVENQHNKKVAETEKKMEEARTSEPELKKRIDPANRDKYSAAEKEAAANILVKKENLSNSTDLQNAVEAIKSANTGNPAVQSEKITALMKKIKPDALEGMTTAQYSSIRALGPDVQKELDKKLKKEGHIKVLIDYDISTGIPRQDAYNKHLGSMSAEEVGKVKGIHGDATHPPDAELVAFVEQQTIHTNNWTPKEHIDAYSKLSVDQKNAWRAMGIHP